MKLAIVILSFVILAVSAAPVEDDMDIEEVRDLELRGFLGQISCVWSQVQRLKSIRFDSAFCIPVDTKVILYFLSNHNLLNYR